MCTILDNNVRSEVFGDNQSEAGKYFLDWLSSGNGKLVVGGRLLRELGGYSLFMQWLQQALLSGAAIRIPDSNVNAETERLKTQVNCRSDDEHVLGLALVSGARLLFTNDRALQDDFKDRQIIPGIRGRIYTTIERKDVRGSHKRMLRRKDLCNV